METNDKGSIGHGALFAVLCLAHGGCGGTSDTVVFPTPYKAGSTTVVGDQQVGGPAAEPLACQDPSCNGALDRCGPNGAADVIVDANGKVIDVVCYGQDVTVAQVPTDQVPSYTTNGNNTVLVLDGVNDGPDVVGDVAITGNNAVLYGSGPDTSVIGGTVQIDKNNATIRGVRIQGDVTIDKNDTKLVFCVIEGNLTITGNNTTLAACDVFGTVTISGLNTTLARDRFAGTDAVTGGNLNCSENVRFDDGNANRVVDPAEVGGPVTCGS